MLDELQRKAEAATPGPWHTGGESGNARRIIYDERGWAIADAKLWHAKRVDGEDVRNAAYIASASPDVVLRLIAVARAAKDAGPALEAGAIWAEGSEAHPRILAALAALRESLAALEAVGKKEGMDKQ